MMSSRLLSCAHITDPYRMVRVTNHNYDYYYMPGKRKHTRASQPEPERPHTHARDGFQ